MVTKRPRCPCISPRRLILAKNHMVTKHLYPITVKAISLILAKNHMVTKLLHA